MATQIAFQDMAAVGGHVGNLDGFVVTFFDILDSFGFFPQLVSRKLDHVGNLSGRDVRPSGKAEFEISH